MVLVQPVMLQIMRRSMRKLDEISRNVILEGGIWGDFGV